MRLPKPFAEETSIECSNRKAITRMISTARTTLPFLLSEDVSTISRYMSILGDNETKDRLRVTAAHSNLRGM